MSAEPITGDGFWKVRSRILNDAWRYAGHAFWRGRRRILDGAGREFCKEKRRILEGEEVTNFGWRGARVVRNYAEGRVFVFATERVFVFATERVFVFGLM